ncbi:MAG: ABC transporter ATP-binding protein [Planctomycetota bacterium]|jgi:ABC-type Fe3+/spermidine/putrescine transport system ATPase subunit
MSRIACESLVRTFDGRRALDGASVEAPSGRFTAILGPSGSGKTTLLRIVAGLEQADGGRVVIGEQTVSDPAPTVAARDRGIGMVFQSLGLWPHMTAAKHLRFVLKARGGDPASYDGRIAELLALVGLPDRGDAKPAELSGGEQQRVALARALAGDPQVLLLDEPFGALDAALRLRLREAVRAVQRTLGLTTVLVTHDQEEALAVADHLVVMNAGRVEQAGPAAELYAAPATAFVAEFLGGAVLVPATVAGGNATTDLGGFATDAADGTYRAVVRHDALAPASAPDGVAATVAASTFTGGHWLVEAMAAGHTLRFRHPERMDDGAAVRLALTGPLHLVADGA